MNSLFILGVPFVGLMLFSIPTLAGAGACGGRECCGHRMCPVGILADYGIVIKIIAAVIFVLGMVLVLIAFVDRGVMGGLV